MAKHAIEYDAVVIGAGAAGLTAASELQSQGLNIVVLEARQKAGGRIDTDYTFVSYPIAGIQPVALPGHTGGKAGYLVAARDCDQQLLIGGDSLHHSILHVRHPEWTTAGDSHPYLVRQTRLQPLNQLVNKNILFRCYHFVPDEIGYADFFYAF